VQPTRVLCPQCGSANRLDAQCCAGCGATLVAGGQERTGTIPTVAAGEPIANSTPATATSLTMAVPSFGEELQPGTFLGPNNRYCIDQLLGRGGFSATYRAYDTQLQRACVVKQLIIDPNWNGDMIQAAQQGFHREVQLLSTLNSPGHPNIPDIYDVLEEHDCLVMKYIEGPNLRTILQQREGPLPLVEALGYVRDICSALAYMHSREPTPVLHRDIKPENILLGVDKRVWLIDFGLAKASLGNSVHASRSLVAGTRGYTPIEQWLGAATTRSDIYALAVTLHTLLTGNLPVVGSADSLDPCQTHISAIPPEVEALIAQGMAEEVSDRPTAREFLIALEALITPITIQRGLHAPDGAHLPDAQALVTWCEQHWQLAVAWLYNRLPDQVLVAWGDTDLVEVLHRSVKVYPTERDAGLDMALALLDPAGFGAAVPTLTVDKQVITFDMRTAQPINVQAVRLINSGRRYVRAHIARPSWMSTPNPTVALIPDQHGAVIFRIDIRGPRLHGWVSGTIEVRQRSGTLAQIRVQVTCLSWLQHVWQIVSASLF
jgi:serine/threonine protein kinase